MQARSQRRHDLIFCLQVFERGNPEPLGFLGNVTMSGVMVISDKPLEPGRVLELEMQDHTAPAREPMVVTASSVWCERDADPRYYAVGFELLDVPLRARQRLRALIDDMGFGRGP